MSASITDMPRSIDEYLEALKRALAGADAALIQDALSDAETHLRAECAARSNESEESVLRAIASSYGLPDDVAAAYRETDQLVQRALTPSSKSGAEQTAPAGMFRRFFSIYGDVRSWTSLMLMLLSLFTGVLYFCVVVTGLSLSLGLMVLIIGLPFFIGFIGLSRVLAHVEGRLVEAMTGERMPRRTPPAKAGGWLERIGAMLRDLRTWSTLAYQLLSLPIGVFSFTVAVTFFAMSLGLVFAGAAQILITLGLDIPFDGIQWGGVTMTISPVTSLLLAVAAVVTGIVVLTSLLYFARWFGRVRGWIAKRMLVALR